MTRSTRKIFFISAIIAVVVSIPAFWFSYPALAAYFENGRLGQELEVAFLDVGQGDAILIKTPFGQNILIDGGPDGAVVEALSERLPFWDRTIDLMVLTHPHDDHVNGLVDVLKRYAVKRVAASGVEHTAPGYLAWLASVRSGRIPLVIIDRPQTLYLGEDCRLEFLFPRQSLAGHSTENLNNSSLVAMLRYGDSDFLFTGDLEADAEKGLMASLRSEASALGAASSTTALAAEVLKAGHHGSDTSTHDAFLAAVAPDIAVISVGADNDFGHPSLRILSKLERAGAAAYRTDLDGTVVLRSNGEDIWKIDD